MPKARIVALSCLLVLAAFSAASGADAPAKKTDASPAAASFTDPTTGMEFVWVEGGCFRMGSLPDDADAFSDETPHHEVCVSGFYIGKFEVTQEQWKKVNKENPSRFQGKNLPVENVTWREATAFAKALGDKSGKTFRLPTEAEWEFAASGGKRSKGSAYAGGASPGDVAWTCDNSAKATHPVGQKQPNELGLHDMSGNVMEWCQDWYNNFYYQTSPKDNPAGPSGGKMRTLRGGSWQMPTKRARPVDRDSAIPAGYMDDIGFRLVVAK